MVRPAVPFFLALLGASSLAITRAEYRVVAMEGYSVPGEEAGTVFGGVDFPIMNAAGDVAFTGRIGFSDGRSTDAVFRSLDGDDTRAIAHAGRVADPVTGVAFPWPDQDRPEIEAGTLFGHLSLNSAGSVAFGAKLASGSSSDSPIVNRNHSVWRVDQTGRHHLLAQTGQQAPELMEGLVFGNDPLLTFGGGDPFRVVGVDDRDRVTFVGHTADSRSPLYRPFDTGHSHVDSSVWQAAPDEEPERLPTRIDTLNDDPNVVATFRTVENEVSSLSGTIAYTDRSLTSDGVGDYSLYWQDNSRGLRLVGSDRSPAPGVEGVTRFAPLVSLDHGQKTFSQITTMRQSIGFVGIYESLFDFFTGLPVIDPVDDPESNRFIYFGAKSGVWFGNADESIKPVVLEGQLAPGIPKGTFSDTALTNGPFSSLAFNEAGEVAFVGSVRGETDSFELLDAEECGRCGVWLQEEATKLDLIAKRGDQPPGVEQGSRFIEFQATSINENGQVAFLASSTDSAPPYNGAFSGNGIWAQDDNDELRLIVREWEQIDVDEDPLVEDFRTIESLNRYSFTPEDEPPTFIFNDRGEIAFWAEFTDGTSGIFVSSLVAVPEPATVLFALMAGVGLATRRRAVVSP